jgi:uncharacterized membrane protein (DUF106 family)
MANQQFNVDQTSFAIETVRSTQTTIAVMKTAAKTLKKENKKINLSELEDMQDEMEGSFVARISRAAFKSHSFGRACTNSQL